MSVLKESSSESNHLEHVLATTKIPEGDAVEYFFSRMENLSGQKRSRTYLQNNVAKLIVTLG